MYESTYAPTDDVDMSTSCADPVFKGPLNDPVCMASTLSTHPSDCWSATMSEGNTTTSVNLFRDVSDDYEVLPAVLGNGSFGCVRECVCRSTGRQYAVKSIEKCNVGCLDHLYREVALLREVDHKNIIRMVDSYEDIDYVHIVTEKYDGGELFDRIVPNATCAGGLSEIESARIVRSLLEAVEYLHERDIVHCDIKPENILLESDEDDGSAIRLVDFGLSQRHDRDSAPMTEPLGTAFYMSPEIIKGRYDRACDLWSVGVVTYVMLTGRPPFNGETDSEVKDAVRRGRIDFHPQVWSALSPNAKDFVSCLLRRDPRKRFSAERALRHPWILENARRPRKVSF